MLRSTGWGVAGLFVIAVVVARTVACGGQEPRENGRERWSSGSAALVANQVCVDGDPLCTPTGAHAKHGVYACSVCHKVAGRLAFDRTGPAYGAGLPTPTFDAVAKSCSNVACHTVAPGTFSYWFQGGDGELQLITVSYGGGGRQTPSWYSTGAATCTACHDDPPETGVWHSGYHTGQGPTAAANQCQFCHPDASSPGNAIGDTITNPALHRNGTVEVQPTFTSRCFNCH